MSHKYKDKDKYVDLKINGRLFPSWVVANFEKYKLDDVIIDDDNACNREINNELRKYQEFVGKFMDFNGPYKNILLYVGLGAGKTRTSINIYNMLYNYTPGWNVFILIKATLKNNWVDELNKFLESEDKQSRIDNITFISYDSPIADKTFMDAVKNTDSSKKNMFIIEEVHNFIRNVYSNISSKQGKRAQNIYDYIIQDQIENQDTRVVVLSATPAVNDPFELALLFNLLRPNIFPKSQMEFEQEFITKSSYSTINKSKKNMFQRRILGLVSYYVGATPDFFATKHVEYVYVKMSEYQEEIYSFFEEIEEKAAMKQKARQSSSRTYKSYTRQACNFVFPSLAQGVNGESRPRPKNFAISDKTGQDILKGNIDIDTINSSAKSTTNKSKGGPEKTGEKYYNAKNYVDAIQKYNDLFEAYISSFAQEDVASKHTLFDDITTCETKYENNYPEFHENEKKKSKVYNALHKSSAKLLHIIFNIFKSKGPVLIYSNYVLMEGIQILKIYLRQFGFVSTSNLESEESNKKMPRYTEYHGNLKQEERTKNKNYFNRPDNIYGELCKIIMISPSGAEGLNLLNVRQVHIMEPFWNEVRIEQMIGRAIRFCSHKNLPKKERHVDVFRYNSVRNEYPKSKWTTDQFIQDHARSKEGLIVSFLDTMKEAAVDCALYKKHNMLAQDYKCFQFEEKTLFNEQINAAYKEDIKDDMKMDNGSNSINSRIERIKVMAILGVILLSKKDDPPIYSEPKKYWYYAESGVVYDYNLYYAIGKVGTSDSGIVSKLDKDTYIIDKLINIPLLKNK